MMKLKKVALVAGLALALVGASGSTVKADTQYVGGGTWVYGYNVGQAYSNYYHARNYHGAQVVDRNNGSNWSRVNSRAGAWASATISISWVGGRASFYYAPNGY
ncbi:MAG: lactococcin 972 family bacteriocin [Streptococcaceae bacterium]|jgi:lactococcin 972 family bacteriocin|nr:lactococcin 972 family bacteriocin [Streptococcaceae bacterium]